MVNFSSSPPVPVHSSFKCTLSPKSLKALLILSDDFGCILIASFNNPSSSINGSAKCLERLTILRMAFVAAPCKRKRKYQLTILKPTLVKMGWHTDDMKSTVVHKVIHMYSARVPRHADA